MKTTRPRILPFIGMVLAVSLVGLAIALWPRSDFRGLAGLPPPTNTPTLTEHAHGHRYAHEYAHADQHANEYAHHYAYARPA